MDEFFAALVLTFMPIFVAIDPVGITPIYVGVTAELTSGQRRKVIWEAFLTALILSVGFLFAGKVLFAALNITKYDFQAGGGLILLAIAVIDIVQTGKARRRGEIAGSLGVVPLGTPLIVGPAVLTTLLLLADLHPSAAGRIALGVSLLANILLVIVLFSQADRLTRLFGQGGMSAVSKVFSLFLAAIAVMMIRRGIMGMIVS